MRSMAHKRNKFHNTLVFLFWLLVIVFVFICFDSMLFPMVRSAAEQKAEAEATFIINDAVSHITDTNVFEYDDLVLLEKNEGGRVVALTTKASNMNKLKALVAVEIYNRLAMYSDDVIGIPLGNVFNNSFLLGKGPKIKVYVRPYSAVLCDYRNVFESSGINQTNHRVMLDIELTVCVIMPFRSVKRNVATSLCVADTVIVGEVPQAFTNVQNYSTSDEGATVADEVVDFGAHNYIE